MILLLLILNYYPNMQLNQPRTYNLRNPPEKEIIRTFQEGRSHCS